MDTVLFARTASSWIGLALPVFILSLLLARFFVVLDFE